MAEKEEQYDENYNPEEDKVEGDYKLIDLPEVPKVTGEENEDLLAEFRAKLYRWRNKEWKERGLGDLKILQNKQTKLVRLLMRQDNTKKVIANFYIQHEQQLCQLLKNPTSAKAWIFNCCDFSEEKAQIDKLCVKLTSQENFEKFETIFNQAKETNKALNKTEKKEDN